MSKQQSSSLPPLRSSRRQRGLSPIPPSGSHSLHNNIQHDSISQPEFLISYSSLNPNQTHPSIVNTNIPDDNSHLPLEAISISSPHIANPSLIHDSDDSNTNSFNNIFTLGSRQPTGSSISFQPESPYTIPPNQK